jgi:BirA family transcriptional regulator, biotin operon repressor / biotin---[acetyl-CoA-carboxylase] ligase
MEDALSPEAVQPLLAGRFGEPYLYEPETESTQLLLLDSGLPEGAVAAAEHQTAGRGRLGRRWTEPAGTSILCSVLLHPPPEPTASELSLVAALAVAEAVQEATGLDAQIKWPNDVLLEGRKVAGMLAEMRGDTVVLGIGINVNQTQEQLAPGGRVPAGSLLTATGRPRDRALLLARLLARLEARYETWTGCGLALLFAALLRRDFLRGRAVTVDGEAGIAVGIQPTGALEVEIGDERRLLDSGEVLLAHDVG